MSHTAPRPAPLFALALMSLLLAAVAVAGDAAAARRLAQQSGATAYIVEVIIFRASSAPSNEDWNAVPPGRGFGSGTSRGGPTPQVLKVLPPTDYRLGSVEQSLKTSGAWHPIAHAAWVQTAANWGAQAGIDLASVGINSPALSGMVYLERAPIYMHLGFDVHLNAGATYTIREMRSVRYNDKQYFDHPAFGIIAMVTPIKRGDTAAPAP
ncbi:MAG: hypothetical protein ACRESY_07665 [Steroidobacteraceae bacterium]